MVSQPHAPAVLSRVKSLYPLYRRFGGPQSLSGRVRNISHPPVFDPRTVHPFASLCTDYKQNKVASVNERYYNALEKYSFSEELDRLLILPVHPQGREREVRKRPCCWCRRPSSGRRYYDASVAHVIKLCSYQQHTANVTEPLCSVDFI